MAWQNSAGMGGSAASAAGGSEAGNNGSQPQGTEYTLQGTSETTYDKPRSSKGSRLFCVAQV